MVFMSVTAPSVEAQVMGGEDRECVWTEERLL